MRFKKIYIEISNICNLKCRFCIQNQREAQMMSEEQFYHIIKEIRPYTDFVYLHVLGEPLLHPKLPEFLDICEREGLQVNITTNGTLLKKCAEQLASHKVRQINISLHSFSEHHQKDYLKQILEGTEQLKQRTFISYRLWNLKQGKLHEDSWLMLRELLNYYQIEKDTNIHPGTSIPLASHVYLNFDEVFEWPSLQHDIVSSIGTCRGFQDQCAILCDGTVVPCCLDTKGDMPLGNVFAASFSDILHTERASVFLQSMKNRKLPEELCRRCGYRTRFDKE